MRRTLNQSLESLRCPLRRDNETLHEERVIAVREEPNLHIFYQRDVPDGMRTTWKLPSWHGLKEFSGEFR